MCRSIKTLRSGAIAATPEEIEAAALAQLTGAKVK